MKVTRFLFCCFAVSFLSCDSTLSDALTTKCDLRQTKFGAVCVCTTERCDYLEEPLPQGDKDIVIVSSSKEGLRFLLTNGTFSDAVGSARVTIRDYNDRRRRRKQRKKVLKYTKRNFTSSDAVIVDSGRSFLQYIYGASASSSKNSSSSSSSSRASAVILNVNVNREVQHQRVVGFGGAFTGTVSYILQQLDQRLQDHIYKSFFHKQGIAFNMARTSIGGCDFDLQPWAYNEKPENDPRLTNFTELDARDERKIEQLKRLQAIAELKALKIMAAAWSPPKWMKSNNDWTGFSYLKTEYYQTWANYHLKFLELMHAKNMPIWAISTGNEPLNGVIGWFFVHFMSLGWTARNQAIWLNEHLGPTIRNSAYKNVLIFGNDDQRYTYPAWFRKMNSTSARSLDYLDGLAVHWYWDDVFGPSLIDDAHREMPDKIILNTESCVGDKPWQTHGPELGSWERGEQYVRALMQDFQHHFNGWIDWNLVLDERGGPNYVDNFVDAPVIVNMTSRSEFYKQPIFYAIGHFSKFLPEGSVRIDVHHSLNINLDVVAFKRPDGSIAVIAHNSGRTQLDVALNDSVRGNIVINIPAHSIHTMVYN